MLTSGRYRDHGYVEGDGRKGMKEREKDEERKEEGEKTRKRE